MGTSATGMKKRTSRAETSVRQRIGHRLLGGPTLPSCASRASGFTLIEMMAVVLIMGLMLALIAPNLRLGGASALRDQALEVSRRLELARQLAVTSGRPHRVLVDLENGEYHIEAYLPIPKEELPTAVPGVPGAPSLADLSPPNDQAGEYQLLTNRFGQSVWLDPDFFFEGLETTEGWFDDGQVAVVFDWDGTTSAAELVIGDTDGRAVTLEVRPLLDRVAVRDENG